MSPRWLTFVVAELGANWRGSVAVLERMLERCKKAGVNAVKFQSLSKELLARHPEWSWYSNCSITKDNITTIDRICAPYGVQWFVTPTYPEAVEFLDPYTTRYKIRHADNQNMEIIEACMKTKRPIIISVGKPLKSLLMFERIKQIYCIPKYPTEYGEINFEMLKLLKGYSNHCLNPLAVLKAVRLGAEYVEFHLMDNRDDFAIDNKVSLSYAEMDEMMKWVRIYEYRA